MDKTLGQEVLEKIAELKMDAKSSWRELVKEKVERKMAQLKRTLERRSTEYELVGVVADEKDPNKAKKTKTKEAIRVWRYVGWDKNKRYTGAKLRQIRREQALQAVAGRTHYNDGTPIVQDRLVDLWK